MTFPDPHEEIGKPKRVSREIKIDHAAVKARIQKQLEATASATVEDVLLHLLETQEEQDRWLLENRAAIKAKIRLGRRGRMTAL